MKTPPAQISSSIFDALDIQSLSPDEQEVLLNDVGDLVFRGTMVRMIESMDEASREAFSTLVSNEGSEEDIEAFIQAHVENPDAIVADVVRELTDDILAVTNVTS